MTTKMLETSITLEREHAVRNIATKVARFVTPKIDILKNMKLVMYKVHS